MEQAKKLTLTVEKVKEAQEELSCRGRGNVEEQSQAKLDKQGKRALKRKLLRQRKKEEKQKMKTG